MESRFPRKLFTAGLVSGGLRGGGIEAVCGRRFASRIAGHVRAGQLPCRTIQIENAGESLSGIGFLVAGHLFRRALSHDAASGFATFGAEIDNPIRLLNHVQVVLNDEHSITKVHEAIQDVQKFLNVVKVQAGGGLVQDVECAAGLTAR